MSGGGAADGGEEAGPGRAPAGGARGRTTIRSAELREISLALVDPFRAGGGERAIRRILLLRISGEDAVGWGECVAPEAPGYTHESTATAWHVLTEHVLPGVPGRELSEPGDAVAHATWIRGHHMALATVEMAAWDLLARTRGTSLARALAESRPGRPSRWEPASRIPAGVAVGFQPDTDELLRRVEGFLERGYRRIKLKVRPGRDLEPLRAVRDRFGMEVGVMADANGSYAGADESILREMDGLGLLMIEQPLPRDDVLGHVRLQAALRTPICLDESIESPGDLELALELGACRVVNLKPGRVGGLGTARTMHDTCAARSVPLWCGGMLESGIGRAHAVALAALPGFTVPGDLSESARYWERDVIREPFVLRDGRLDVPDGPGIGVTPDLEWIEERTLRKLSFHAGS